LMFQIVLEVDKYGWQIFVRIIWYASCRNAFDEFDTRKFNF